MTSESPLVIYHANCFDGFCALWVAHKALGHLQPLPMAHGHEPPNVTGRDVYILDFSFKRPVMLRLLSQARRLALLDHHQTAKVELDGIVDEFVQRPDLIQNIPGSHLPFIWVADGKSGGRMAWEHFFVDRTASWLVDYTEDRDLWRHKLPFSREVNAALRSYDMDVEMWDGLALHYKHADGDGFRHHDFIVAEGRAIMRAERKVVEAHVDHARRVRLDGFDVLAVNATVLFSDIASKLAEHEPFGVCYFDRADGMRQFSLRSDEHGVDVSEVARKFGGGGHRHAAGFQVPIPAGGELL